MQLKGKAALVTGASRGIGKAICLELAGDGCNIAAVARTRRNIEETARLVESLGAKATAITCDVANEKDVKNAVAKTVQKFGRIDFMINNAGVIVMKDLDEMTEKEWDYVLDINLKGAFLFSRHVVPLMKKQGKGTIVNISSGLGRHGYSKLSSYCASKFGVIGLTESLAMETKSDGIKVYAVCPGGVDTDMYKKAWGSSLGTMKPEHIAKVVAGLCINPKNKSGDSIDVFSAQSALQIFQHLGRLKR